jgi:hypothetical protein
MKKNKYKIIKNANLVIQRDEQGIFRLYLRKNKHGELYLFCPKISVEDIRVEGTTKTKDIFLRLHMEERARNTRNTGRKASGA